MSTSRGDRGPADDGRACRARPARAISASRRSRRRASEKLTAATAKLTAAMTRAPIGYDADARTARPGSGSPADNRSRFSWTTKSSDARAVSWIHCADEPATCAGKVRSRVGYLRAARRETRGHAREFAQSPHQGGQERRGTAEDHENGRRPGVAMARRRQDGPGIRPVLEQEDGIVGHHERHGAQPKQADQPTPARHGRDYTSKPRIRRSPVACRPVIRGSWPTLATTFADSPDALPTGTWHADRQPN